jgi:hypothetical protein
MVLIERESKMLPVPLPKIIITCDNRTNSATRDKLECKAPIRALYSITKNMIKCRYPN